MYCCSISHAGKCNIKIFTDIIVTKTDLIANFLPEFSF